MEELFWRVVGLIVGGFLFRMPFVVDQGDAGEAAGAAIACMIGCYILIITIFA